MKTPSKLPIVPIAQSRGYRSYVIYGRSGTGKTTFSSTFPKNILHLDIRDDGTDSIADVEGIDLIRVDSWDEFEDVYWWLIANKDHGYQTLTIDTITQLQSLAVEHIVSKKNKKVENAGDWGTMTKKEWGDVSSLMKDWITRLRDLKMNVIFLAQERVFNSTEEAEVDGDMLNPEVGPRLSPATKDHLNSVASVVANTFIRARIKVIEKKGKKVEEEVYDFCLRLAPNSVYTTKVRKPLNISVPKVIKNPSFEELNAIIRGE